MNLERKNKYKDIALILMGYGLLVSCVCMFNMHLSNKYLKDNYQRLQKQIFLWEVEPNDKQIQDYSK